jgi:hypothetical protein
MRPLEFAFNKTACIFDGPAGVVRPTYFREFQKPAQRKVARIVRAVAKETGLEGDALAEELNERYEVVRATGRINVAPRPPQPQLLTVARS